MNIYEALKQTEGKKRAYFEWKHDIRFVQDAPKKSEDDFLKTVGLKTLNGFIRWEKSQEYKNLVLLLLDSKVANDYDVIYKNIVDKAKDGDEKFIRLFLSIQKDIQSNAKLAAKTFNVVEEESEENEDLVLD
ncbi:hypothetical protein JGK52_03925 [Cytobacillus oceanisediminis]|uniref:hypothetical protein n=1 Tax=Cytobacillus oceanisediminis TaxID=665099 RepID=UPI001D14578C|nr:hypothetical protein [Cytobacillus oceanisediminis]MCC3645833.1 hypothetical protein [Cytobacillus oceanisediminis]